MSRESEAWTHAACSEGRALVRLSVRSLWLPHWPYRGVDLWVPGGELAVMVGDQTGVEVLRVVEGQVIPTHGDVAVDDESFGFEPPSARRKRAVERVAEEIAPTHQTVRDVLAGAEAEAVNGRARPAADVLSLLPRLAALSGVRTDSLDPGDRAVLAVGLALVRRPRLLLAAGLAKRMTDDAYLDVLAAFRSVATEDGMAVLLAEEAIVRDDRYDSVYVVRRGHIWRSSARNDDDSGVDESSTEGEGGRVPP